ncbi:RhoGAP domain protein [Oesophagostomum dentatum]|uniref:RhoGAP domain protein n=1 Tax=Oesophagostomum dentatum TaxID=61180 RepID=A0A0B1T0Z4_OESDE|nr:RhoGAP domain protein [Oesophagostomum dentatum]
MVEELEKEKKRKGLRLVSRKSTKKMLGKWKKLDEAGDKSDKEYMAGENEPLRQVLGVQLETAIEVDPSLDGVPLPAFFRHAIDYVETHGLTLEGIYRVSSPKSRLDELEKKANDGSPLNFVEGHEAAGLIKRFLRQLPEPLLSSDFENLVKNCTCDWRGVCQCSVRSQMKEKLRRSGRAQYYLLGYLLLHVQNVIRMESENKMGIHALGLLFQTVLDISRQLVCYLIVNASGRLCKDPPKVDYLFDDVTIVP